MKNSLLCWHAKRAGLEVLANSLRKLKGDRQISKVIYLTQSDIAKRELEALENEFGVRIEQIKIELSDPVNHLEIYEKLERSVLQRLKEEEKIYLNISPGTPAMHAVWLFLFTGGALPPNLEIVSTQYNPQSKRTLIKNVKFPVTTYLAAIRKNRRISENIARYDPQSAKSEKLRESLERLSIYSLMEKAPLLVLGERGTGKTRIIETHVSVLKGNKEVVVVPCGGLDSTLADSMLFGHKKGSFSGAVEDRKGILMEAKGKILFLDEVQDLPKTTQRKLVRVFQDKSQRFRRIGDDVEMNTDVELICASNLDYKSLRQKLDPDLFDRLSHFIVELPPLRQCRAEIARFWESIWIELSDEPIPNNPALDTLFTTDAFTGNFRDLEKLALLIKAWKIRKTETEAIQTAIAEWKKWSQQVVEDKPFEKGTRTSQIKRFQKELATWAVEEYGSTKQAAIELDCSERTLQKDLAESI